MYIDIYKMLEHLEVNYDYFQSEAQFQFSLAWEIKKEYPDYDVLLEFMSATKKIRNYILILL